MICFIGNNSRSNDYYENSQYYNHERPQVPIASRSYDYDRWNPRSESPRDRAPAYYDTLPAASSPYGFAQSSSLDDTRYYERSFPPSYYDRNHESYYAPPTVLSNNYTSSSFAYPNSSLPSVASNRWDRLGDSFSSSYKKYSRFPKYESSNQVISTTEKLTSLSGSPIKSRLANKKVFNWASRSSANATAASIGDSSKTSLIKSPKKTSKQDLTNTVSEESKTSEDKPKEEEKIKGKNYRFIYFCFLCLFVKISLFLLF
jgi:hypothetical protein